MLRFADLLEKHNDEVAAIETWDNGKTYEQAANVEIPMVVRVFRYYAGDYTIFEFTYVSCCYMIYIKLTLFTISDVFIRLGR